MDQNKQASEILSLLRNPVKIVKDMKELEIAKKTKSRSMEKTMQRFLHTVLPFTSNEFEYDFGLEVSKRVHALDFNFPDILRGIRKADKYRELSVKEILLSWQPFISGNMSGQTTVLLCDFRSTLSKNISKIGYTFPVSKPVIDLMALSPGYNVSLNDPNLDRVFRFLIFTNGLDLMPDSIYGKLIMKVKFQLGRTSDLSIDGLGQLILVGSTAAESIIPGEQNPGLVNDDLQINEVLESFNSEFSAGKMKDLNAVKFDNLQDYLNRSTSSRSNSSDDSNTAERNRLKARYSVSDADIDKITKEVISEARRQKKPMNSLNSNAATGSTSSVSKELKEFREHELELQKMIQADKDWNLELAKIEKDYKESLILKMKERVQQEVLAEFKGISKPLKNSMLEIIPK